MRSAIIGVLVAGAVFAVLSACASRSDAPGSSDDAGTDAGDEGGLTFGGMHDADPDAPISVRASTVLASCVGGPESSCHGSNAGNMHLPDDPPNLVGVPSSELPAFERVKTGDPEDSYLFMKVIADPRISGARMPMGGSALASDDIETLRAWIEAGAPRAQ